MCAVLPDFLSHIFAADLKKEAGMRYIDYLTTVRLEHAHSMITGGSAVSTAAFHSGFEDTSYFIKRFKERYGSTPKKLMNSSR